MSKQTRHIFLLAPILLIVLSACNKPGPAQEAGRHLDEAAAHAESNRIDTAASDADITAKVKMALMMRDGLNSLTISVKTDMGIVTLSGSVINAAQSLLAQELAMSVDDVVHVDNHLSVVPSTK